MSQPARPIKAADAAAARIASASPTASPRGSAARLPGRHRTIAVLASLAGPILLAAGLFAAAW